MFATIMVPVIFKIEPSSLSNNNSSDDSYLSDTKSIDNNAFVARNASLINTLGLDRVSQYPSNAIFDVNDEERASMSFTALP